jgi:hypothetical protein
MIFGLLSVPEVARSGSIPGLSTNDLVVQPGSDIIRELADGEH